MSGIINSAGSKSGVIGQTEIQRFSENYDRPGDGHYDDDSYTKLLLQSDTTNNSTTFVDSSSFGTTVTRSNQAHHTTEHAVIGSSSFEFDGANDSLNVPATSALAFGASDFTIDFWIYPHSLPNMWFFSGTADHNLCLNYGHQSTEGDTTGSLEAWASTNGSSWNIMGDGVSGRGTGITGQFKVGVWQHLAYVREGTAWKIFCNGDLNMIATAAGSITAETANGMAVGTHAGYGGSYGVHGHIDEFRVSIGIARWTSPFRVYPKDEL